MARGLAELEVMEKVLPGAYVSAFKPEHQLPALEDRHCDGQRIHLVVQPELTHEHTVSHNVQLDGIQHILAGHIPEHLGELIDIFPHILNREGATLILAHRVEGSCGRLLVAAVVQKQGYAHIDSAGSAGAHTRIGRDVRTADAGADTGQEHKHGIHNSHILKAQRDIRLKHEALVDLAAILHPEGSGDGAAVEETVIHTERGQVTDESSVVMEIRPSAEIYQVGLIRGIRNLAHKEVIVNGFAPIKDDIAHTYDRLFLLACATARELERTALVNRDTVVLTRPGRVNLAVEDELVVHVYEQIVVIHI